jgi:hypothetical protein
MHSISTMSLLMLLVAFACFLPFIVSTPIKESLTKLDQKIVFLQGDILLPPGAGKQRNAILKPKRWTNGILPYVINSTGYTQADIDMIKEGMRTIERHTCIRFPERTNEKNYIVVVNGGGCSSHVGMLGNNWPVQYVSLNKDACMIHRTIVHELLHAIGLHHEQSRYDRDDYLTIHKDKLADPNAFEGVNLVIMPETETSFYGIPYNYASVMQYSAWDLGNNRVGDIVMEPKDLSMLAVMGYSKTANETDFEKVRRLYECKGKYPVVPPDNSPCEDEYKDCDINSDRCKTDRSTAVGCRKTCGYCVWGGPITATPRPFCQDYRPDCGYPGWQTEACKTDEMWRERTCPFSCGFCDKSKTQFPASTTSQPKPPPAPTPKCVDTNIYCKEHLDQCRDTQAVREQCRKTCNLC